MRKFFSISITLTLLTLLYVYQNVEIINIGYGITKQEQLLSTYLDEHKQLVYNLNKLESPFTLCERLSSESIELVEADVQNIYYACVKAEQEKPLSPRISMLDRFFDSITLTAEARDSK
ncbi:MAG: hypothetical protein PHQ52_00575 [Candidatus Omnitrophica bacterium]|jgi:hypothetical protein|nr:hypothetical protein [Candidatus Omnitrophota bacterium]